MAVRYVVKGKYDGKSVYYRGLAAGGRDTGWADKLELALQFLLAEKARTSCEMLKRMRDLHVTKLRVISVSLMQDGKVVPF